MTLPHIQLLLDQMTKSIVAFVRQDKKVELVAFEKTESQFNADQLCITSDHWYLLSCAIPIIMSICNYDRVVLTFNQVRNL